MRLGLDPTFVLHKMTIRQMEFLLNKAYYKDQVQWETSRMVSFYANGSVKWENMPKFGWEIELNHTELDEDREREIIKNLYNKINHIE